MTAFMTFVHHRKTWPSSHTNLHMHIKIYTFACTRPSTKIHACCENTNNAKCVLREDTRGKLLYVPSLCKSDLISSFRPRHYCYLRGTEESTQTSQRLLRSLKERGTMKCGQYYFDRKRRGRRNMSKLGK